MKNNRTKWKTLPRVEPAITDLFTELYLNDGVMERKDVIAKVFNGDVGLSIYWLNEMHLKGVIFSTGDNVRFVGNKWKAYINLLDLPKKEC